MHVVTIPQLMDNYAYLLIDEDGRAAVVDPAEADVILDAVDEAGLSLEAVLSTHHHADHTAGNLELAAAVPGLRVLGFARDAARIPGLTERVEDGGAIRVGALRGTALAVPCHTSGHVAYRFGDALFTGDTLFAAGCGRFFEGTAAEMHRALVEIIGALPDRTQIYCGHEYTEQNLRFAAHVEPDNPAIAEKRREVRVLAGAGVPSVPTTLGEERLYNPFLRTSAAGVRASVARARPEVDLDDPIAVLGALRAMKDDF